MRMQMKLQMCYKIPYNYGEKNDWFMDKLFLLKFKELLFVKSRYLIFFFTSFLVYVVGEINKCTQEQKEASKFTIE